MYCACPEFKQEANILKEQTHNVKKKLTMPLQKMKNDKKNLRETLFHNSETWCHGLFLNYFE